MSILLLLFVSLSYGQQPARRESAHDWTEENGHLEGYPEYLRSSWRLLQIARKAYLEKLRQREDFQGYFYWPTTDVPASRGFSASWEWGWFNDFWEPKGIKPEEGREIQEHGAVQRMTIEEAQNLGTTIRK